MLVSFVLFDKRLEVSAQPFDESAFLANINSIFLNERNFIPKCPVSFDLCEKNYLKKILHSILYKIK